METLRDLRGHFEAFPRDYLLERSSDGMLSGNVLRRSVLRSRGQ